MIRVFVFMKLSIFGEGHVEIYLFLIGIRDSLDENDNEVM